MNDILSFQKESGEVGLRLVSENANAPESAAVETQFVNFMFYRIDPDWRKIDPELKAAIKDEFNATVDTFRKECLVYTYSLVGFDSKADLMFWRIAESLDVLQDMTAEFYRTKLGSYIEPTDNYLSITKQMMFVDTPAGLRTHVEAGTKKYLFVYPCAKHRDWYSIPAADRDVLIKENFMVGARFPNIKIHMTHAFGFNDHEYLVSFETDEPKDFLTLAEDLRQTNASKFTLGSMPIYTCRQLTLRECLNALG